MTNQIILGKDVPIGSYVKALDGPYPGHILLKTDNVIFCIQCALTGHNPIIRSETRFQVLGKKFLVNITK